MNKLLISLAIVFFLFCFGSVSDVKAEEELLILFDSSLSMMENLGSEPKYVHAVRSAKKILSQVNPSQKVGLRIIGMQLNAGILNYIKNPENLCKATELMNPIRINNANNIAVSLDSLVPLGMSPLTYSLAQAINNDFSQSANPKHIILITDGAESCNQDPCRYIKELTLYRNDIKVDVIAINVKGDEITQLKCISENSGGMIKKVNTSAEFDAAFRAVVTGPQYTYADTKRRNRVQYKNYLIETFN